LATNTFSNILGSRGVAPPGQAPDIA